MLRITVLPCDSNHFFTVPVLEIDGNVVVNDSYDIHKYLIEHYPGKGNSSLTEDQKSLQEDYIQTHLKWDEYLFSYRCMPKFLGGAFHQIRLVELSKAVKTATTEGKLDEILMDGRTVKQAYIDKVVQTRSLIRIGCDDDTLENLQQRIKANEEFMEAILTSTDELLASHKLLMTDDELTSADVYLAVLLNRIATVNGELLGQIFAKYPKIESWWKHFNTLKESEALAFGPSSKIAMLFSKGPRIFLHSLGMLNPEPLPDVIEQEVVKELDRFMSEYYKV